MKDCVELLQRKGMPAKGWVSDLDDNQDVVLTLGKWAKAAAGRFDPAPLHDEYENQEAQQNEGFSQFLRRTFTSPQAKGFYRQIMYGERPGEQKKPGP